MIVSSVLLENYGFVVSEQPKTDGRFSVFYFHSNDKMFECLYPETPDSFPESGKFYICWQGRAEPRKWRGRYYLDEGAVEPVARWSRESDYQAKFSETDSFGKKAETAAICAMMRTGILVHRANAFEDEILGIDMWFRVKGFVKDKAEVMQSKSRWLWLPINLTLKPEGLKNFDPWSKYEECRKRRVLSARIPNASVHCKEELVHWLKASIRETVADFDATLTHIISRQEALTRELCYAPNVLTRCGSW